VQVDPIKPTWKAPGSKRLKLEHEKQLSNFAFNFNSRRYTVATAAAADATAANTAGPLASVDATDADVVRGRAVQVGSIKPRVESAYGFSA